MFKTAKLIVFLCIVFSLDSGVALASTKNWCGVYFENKNQGYIGILRNDVGAGSEGCSLSEYNERKEDERVINIALMFTRNNFSVAKWRKFSGHLIEVRGKYKNGTITSTKFVRDLGR